MEFRILGPLEIADGDRLVPLGAGKPRALLAILLIHANEIVSNEQLIEDLWPDTPPVTATKSVQVYVSQVRKALRGAERAVGGDGVVLTRPGGYVLSLAADRLDAKRLEQALQEGRRVLELGDPDAAAERLRCGLALWRGPPLADFRYEAFAQPEIARLEELRLAALEERIEADLAGGRHAGLAGELAPLVAAQPLRERLRAQLMVALYRCDRQAEALEVYREGRHHLVEELGLEPSPRLQALERAVLAQSPELAAQRNGNRPEASVSAPMPASAAPAAVAATAVPAAIRATAPLAAAVPPGPSSRRSARRALLALGAATLLAALGVAAAKLLSPASAPATRIEAPLRFNALAAVGGRTGFITAAVPVPGRLGRVAESAGTLWVGGDDSRTVTGVDRHGLRMTRTIATGLFPADVAAGGGAVWVVDGHRDVLAKIHPGYGRVTDRLALRRPATDRVPAADRFAADPTSVAVGAGGVWVTDGARRLLRVDPATVQVAATIDAGRPLTGVAVGADAVWAIGTPATVLRIDPSTNRVTDRIPIARTAGADGPRAIAVAVGEGFVWVLDANTATLVKINPRTRGIVQTTRVGVDRSPLQVAAGAGAAWVANDDGTLSRIDARTGALASVPVGHGLRDVAVSDGAVWVTNQLTRCCGQE